MCVSASRRHARFRGDYRLEIHELIARLALTDRIRITGFRNDIANYVNLLEISAIRRFRPEPFGRVLLERWRSASRSWPSKAGCFPRIVVDGTTGLLFEPGDADGLAVASDVACHPELALRLGQAGRRRLET